MKKIQLFEVIDALYRASSGMDLYYLPAEERFYSPEDGDLYQNLDSYEGEIIGLYDRRFINEYSMMEDFIESKVSGEPKKWLANAIVGKGAFHRFKVTCDRFDLLSAWYDYRDKCFEGLAAQWCDENAIEYEYFRKVEVEDDDAYYDEEEEETEYEADRSRVQLKVVAVNEKNVYSLLSMTADFRKVLASMHGVKIEEDLQGAEEELMYYLKQKYPVFAVSQNGRYVGYAVCKVLDSCVWLESIYVRKDSRRQGVATMLLKKCEEVAAEYGNETLYINIHPNNHLMILFLQKNGYDVLNLIEVRKLLKDEVTDSEYRIGEHNYRY